MENPPVKAENEAQNSAAQDKTTETNNAGASSSNKKEPPAFKVLDGFNRLDILRQAGLLFGFAASIAIGFAVVMWSQEENYRPLLSSLSNDLNSASIMEILETNQIEYKVDPNSGALLVPADQIYNARMKVAAADLGKTDMLGYELLDQEQALGTSQFMETARYRRSLEGELARTISSLKSVRHARVHLAIPKQSVFLRDQRKPSASVFLTLSGTQGLDKTQANSIVNLVASSVPEMSPTEVTLVDQNGNLLSGLLDKKDSLDQEMQRQLEYVRKVEQTLTERVRNLLEPIVGAGRFQAAVSVDIDFTQVEQSEEQFNPDLPAVRSEQLLTERRNGDFGPQGIPGALSNQPPRTGEAPEIAGNGAGGGDGDPLNTKSQTTRNYELDRTLSYTRNQVGRTQRLSVAVVVDDMIVRLPATEEGGEAGADRRPWDENELQRLTQLVQDAVGYRASRGDSVSVINTPFVDSQDNLLPDIPIWEQPWFWDLAKQVLAGLFILILIFGVLRPILRNLASAADNKDLEEAELEAIPTIDSDLSDDQVTLSASDDPLLAPPSDSYERQLNAIRSLIAEDPGRVAQVVRQWLNSDE